MDRSASCGRIWRTQMRSKWTSIASVALIVPLSTIAPRAAQDVGVTNVAQPSGNRTVVVRTASVGGIKLQYLTAGRGPAVGLLDWDAGTARSVRPLMAEPA